MEIEMITGRIVSPERASKRYTSTPDAGCTRPSVYKRDPRSKVGLSQKEMEEIGLEVKEDVLLVMYGILEEQTQRFLVTVTAY